jgi:hypothetical protein
MTQLADVRADVRADAPELQASRIVGKLLAGDVSRAKTEEQLDALGYVFYRNCWAHRKLEYKCPR